MSMQWIEFEKESLVTIDLLSESERDRLIILFEDGKCFFGHDDWLNWPHAITHYLILPEYP